MTEACAQTRYDLRLLAREIDSAGARQTYLECPGADCNYAERIS